MASVSDSELPGLMGLNALVKNKAIIDFGKLEMYFAGPGNYDLERSLPPGTDLFACERAPSGHLVVPCCEFGLKEEEDTNSLTLLSREPATGSGTTTQ